MINQESSITLRSFSERVRREKGFWMKQCSGHTSFDPEIKAVFLLVYFAAHLSRPCALAS